MNASSVVLVGLSTALLSGFARVVGCGTWLVGVVGELGTLLGPEGSPRGPPGEGGVGFLRWPPSLKPRLLVWWGCWWVWCLVVEQWTRASGKPLWLAGL
jgi:hypothetical protein